MASPAYSAGLIAGGSFEGSDVNVYWSYPYCGRDWPALSDLPSFCNQKYGEVDNNVAFISAGALSLKCGSTSSSCGTYPICNSAGYTLKVCITTDGNSANSDCNAGLAAAGTFPNCDWKSIHHTPTITATKKNYGSDFNIVAYLTVSGNDYNLFNIGHSSAPYGAYSFDKNSKIIFDFWEGYGYNGALFGPFINIDNIRATGHTVLAYFDTFNAYSNRVSVKVTDINGMIVQTGQVKILADSVWRTATYNTTSQKYDANLNLAPGTYNIVVQTSWEGIDKNTSYTNTYFYHEYNYLTFTPIENADNWNYGSIYITPSDELGQIVFRVDSNSGVSQVPTYILNNSLNDGRQYFIYTSSDGNAWVFNDSLTYGTTISTPIQKIWDDVNKIYQHSFYDTLSPLETKYYKLVYQHPYKSWNSIAYDGEWFNNLEPSISDSNYNVWDIYSVSSYANIYSYYVVPVPDAYRDLTDVFEFQFTAWADTNNAVTIQAGQVTDGVESLESVTISSVPHRYSVTINPAGYNSQVLIKTGATSSYQVYLMDYTLVSRAYFTKRMIILKDNLDFLDSILLNGTSKQYLQEGYNFNLSTEAYDRNGDLSELTINAYFDTNAAANRVKQQLLDLAVDNNSSPETYLGFNQNFDPIIDLNGSASNPAAPRNLIIEAVLVDRNGQTVAIQSLPVKFIQYPYFPDDIRLDYFPTEKRKGKHPDGILNIELKNPGVLEGFDIRIYSDANTVSSPNYQAKVYNGYDFDCSTNSCNFQLKIEDWVYEDVNKTTVTIFALINTEYLDQTNYLTRVDRTFFVSPIEFSTAKIYEVMEREDHTYNTAEDIPLVLLLKDSEATDITGKLNVYITLANCDGNSAPNCVEQTTKYKPTGQLYDERTNATFYFFRYYYTLDDGSALPDGNYIRFRATVADATGARANITPVLAHRCYNDVHDSNKYWWLGPIGVYIEEMQQLINRTESALFGCTTPQAQLVTTAVNSDQERYLLIDASKATQNPSNVFWGCVAPDQNNIYSSSLKKDLSCAVLWTVSEKPIDSFRIRIGNQYSDYKITGSEKQYVEYNIPYELIATSDIPLIVEQIKPTQDTSINTVGEFLYYGLFKGLTDPDYGATTGYILPEAAKGILKNGLIGNMGGDFNYDQVLNPSTVGGAMFITFKGINVINADDYKSDFELSEDEDYEFSTLKNFLKAMQENNIYYSSKPSKIAINTGAFNTMSILPIPQMGDSIASYLVDNEGSLVINEKPIEVSVNVENTDKNVYYKEVPNKLSFLISETMFYNNMSENQTLAFTINIYEVIKSKGWAGLKKFIEELKDDPINSIQKFLIEKIAIIVIVLGLLLGISYIVYLLRGGRHGGGVTMTTHHHHYRGR
jgi:hypothetical protein